MIRPKDLIPEFWMVNKDPFKPIEIKFKGDLYIFECDMNDKDSWFSFTSKDNDSIVETFMFKFILSQVVECDE